MTLHLGLPHGHHRRIDQQQEVREARKLLKERVRDDWAYPVLPAYRLIDSGRNAENSEPTTTVGGFRFHIPDGEDGAKQDDMGLDFRVTGWQTRAYASDTDGSGDERRTKKVFRFEDPDSVGDEVLQRRQERRRRRFQTLEQEMDWNDGLAHWVKRRDEWSGAKLPSEADVAEPEQNTKVAASSTSTLSRLRISLGKASEESPRSSTSSSPSSHNPESEPSTIAVDSSSATTPDLSHDAESSTSTPTLAVPLDVMIPVAATILPNHPIRRRITPSLYNEIYTKIIVQGRTPSVPINLQTLINALVQGWKDDGEWPPKPGTIEPSMRRSRKGPHGSENALKSGVKAVGRVLRLTGIGDS